MRTLLLLLVLCSAAWGAEPLDAARARFKDAEQAIAAGRFGQAQRLAEGLRDYPLYPYLRYAALRHRLATLPWGAVEGFAAEFDDAPVAARLRHAWLRQAARRGDRAALVAHYRDQGDTDLRCRYGVALLQEGRRASAWAQAEALWKHGHSQPRSCDALFDAWRAAGGLTQDLVWARIYLAMDAGQSRLAHYLARFLKPAERHWLGRWEKLRRDPEKVIHARWLSAKHPAVPHIAADAIARLADTDPVPATEQWLALAKRRRFEPSVRRAMGRRLALELVRAGTDESHGWLNRLADRLDDDAVEEWSAFGAMLAGDWPRALKLTGRLSPAQQDTPRWHYWRGRVLEALKRYEQAGALYAKAAGDRSFYGFLAADRIGSPYRFSAESLDFDAAEIATVAARPGLQRARELYRLGRLADARREWRYAVADLSRHQLEVAARLAHGWGWHDRVIFALGQAQAWDDLKLRFPLAHQDLVEARAEQEQINPAWAFAVIRQESAFTPDIRSGAGAIGLMQLMPATARHVARSLNLQVPDRHDLTEPPTNIQLGVAYLNEVKQEFDGHPVLSTAAYNAGIRRVRGWLRDDRSVPADLWIETVPFRETRKYLKRVLTYTIIYERRLGQSGRPLRDYMPPVPSRTRLLTHEAAVADGRDT